MPKSKTKSLLITLLILAVLGLAVLGYGVYYIGLKNKETSELSATIEANSKSAALIQSIKSLQNNSGSDLDTLDNVALSEADLVTFIENLESLGKGMGLQTKIASVSIESPKDTNSPSKIHLKIETSGGWGGTLQFAHALENLPYRTIINYLNLSTDNVNTGGEVLTTGSTTQPKIIWKSSSEIALYTFK
jgi:Tfp pilus assembly protein PilO